MATNFVIITNQRSGSNMLVSMLDSHPQIRCFGELMRVTPDWMKRDGYRGVLRVLDQVDQIYKEDQYRFQHPYEFVRAAFATAPKRDCYGFKIHLAQHPEFLSELIQDREWQLVVLQRENKLAQFSSSKIAEVTGQGNAPKGTRIVRARVEFKNKEFGRFLSQERKQWERVWSDIQTSGKDYFYLRYVDLVSKSAIQKLFKFLGVDPGFDVEPGTEKRNPSDILDRFTNREDVARTLEQMEKTEWSREDLTLPASEANSK